MKTIDKHNPKLASKKQGSRPSLPDGVSNFHELVTHRNPRGDAYLFVDKSLFIRDFLNAADKVALITRPRRFGKTLTLSMLQHFLAAEVNGQSTKGLFDGLKISRYPEIMKLQGQYPVIFLTLKEVKGKSFKEIFERVKQVIGDLFQTHRYLLTEGHLAEENRIKFKNILNETATQAVYESSLHLLSKLLYQHTGKKSLHLARRI